MVGLSGQTRAKALSTVDYCRHLVERFGADPRLQFYVAPLGPFLDPGSRAYEHPERLGFHRRLTTLAEHRAALLGPTWRDMLSYETDWMSRDEIVAVTYQVGRQLNDLKFDAGLIDAGTHASVAAHLRAAVGILADVEALSAVPDPERRRRLRLLQKAAQSASAANLVGEDELKWRSRTDIRLSLTLMRTVAGAMPRELAKGFARLLRRYDTAVARPRLLPPWRPGLPCPTGGMAGRDGSLRAVRIGTSARVGAGLPGR